LSGLNLPNFLWNKKILIAVAPQPIPTIKNTAAARNAKISGSARMITPKPTSNSPTADIATATFLDARETAFV